MHVINARNVEEAYQLGMQHLSTFGVRSPSRAGEVLVAPSPVTTVYHRPQERVLMDTNRDANPFFHLMEAVWMLAGRRDATWLDRYVRDFSSRFAEENGEAHGAYGHRWRWHFGIDQLLAAGSILLENPESRQAVISMWDPNVDLGVAKKDIPCNDMIMLRGRMDHRDKRWELDVTVLCRSNDAVWGAYGANAVHMSIMAEALAGLCGMRLGRYYQVSNNFHVYLGVMQKVWPPNPFNIYRYGYADASPLIERSIYGTDLESRKPAAIDARSLLDECVGVCDLMGGTHEPPDPKIFKSEWLRYTVIPLAKAHYIWAAGDREKALESCSSIRSRDWQWAARSWMARRLNKESGVPEARGR